VSSEQEQRVGGFRDALGVTRVHSKYIERGGQAMEKKARRRNIPCGRGKVLHFQRPDGYKLKTT